MRDLPLGVHISISRNRTSELKNNRLDCRKRRDLLVFKPNQKDAQNQTIGPEIEVVGS